MANNSVNSRASVPAGDIDPVTASVIQGSLQNIAIEMGFKLMRMSYSSIIRESEDFGAAVLDEHGNQIAESTQSTPLQSGPIPGYVKNALRQLGERGQKVEPGDVIMHNDPYGGGSHGPDVAFIIPVFVGDTLAGFTGTTAHHLDLGALTPGSAGIVDAIDAFAEGLQFKAIKVYERGHKNEAVWQILRDNVRAPKLVVGDMEAQIAAGRIGAQRLLDLIDRFGLDTVRAANNDLMDYSERRMRKAISEVEDGVYEAETMIDGYLDDPSDHRKNLPLKVRITVSGDELTVDLTGTAAQVSDRPINLPFEGTTDIGIWLTIRSVLLDTAVHGYIPQNTGLTRPITIIAPKGTLANPEFPAPTIARFAPGNQLCDTVMKALAQAKPRQVSAGIGNLKVIAFSGLQSGNHWVHMEIFEGSYGGRYGMDGMDAVDTLFANTRNNPIEDIETHLPLRVRRYELRENVNGAGQWRGGFGSIREFEFVEDGGASVEGEGHAFKPWGFLGGHEGEPAQLKIISAAGEVQDMPSKMSYKPMARGDRFQAVGPSGGGYGSPLERNPADVLDDVLDELISNDVALNTYGVIIKDGAIDAAATEQKRAELRGSAGGTA